MPFELTEVALRFRYVKNLWNSIIDYISQVKGLFGSFRAIDVLDILFVAFMLYVVIRFVRETRAIQLIKGLFLFAVLYFIVSFLGMGASSYLLRMVFSNILIIIVVLFGPEIRNILEQLGTGAARNGFLRFFKNGGALEAVEINKSIDATCKACSNMSDTKTGALIVFEKESLLGESISSGTMLDSAVSRELIENIFFPKSPLHDGAMILRRGRILAAGCILPLTKDTNVSSGLGTRHRAAIGLSQESDAVVVVVSEETGGISVAKGGNLRRDIKTGELRELLISELIPDDFSSDDKKIKKFVRRIKK